MSATTTTVETSSTARLTTDLPRGRMVVDGKATNYGDFRDDLNRDGYAVIKAAVPRERADAYSDAFYSYMEGL
jgi:hypothetical protein